MRITESRIRQIIREETKNVVSESMRMTLRRLTADLNKAGESRLADRLGGRRPESHLDSAVRFRDTGDVVKVYFVSPEGTSQYVDDIPMDVARKLGLNESRRLPGGRALREGNEGMWFGGYDDSDLVYLDSGDKGLDDAWANWAGATKVLLLRAGSRSFKSESGDAPTVKEMMAEIIGSL